MSPTPSIATIFSFSNTNLLAIRLARACAASSHQATVQVLAVLSLADVLSRESGNQFSGRGLLCDCTSVPWFDRSWSEFPAVFTPGMAPLPSAWAAMSSRVIANNTMIERNNSA